MKNHYRIKDDIAEIYLRRRNGDIITTIIDTSDLMKLMELDNTWFAHWYRYQNTYYVGGNIPGTKKKVRLHRFLLDAPKGSVVDHINHNPLDNRRSNLRIVNHSANMQNASGAYRNSVSGVRGVVWDKLTNKWRAVLRVNGKQIHLGRFSTIEEAEIIVKKKRKEFMNSPK